MRYGASIGLAAILLCGPAWANDTAGANNGIGHQGSLTSNAGSHSSKVTAAQLVTHPKAPGPARNDPKLEGDAAQGGSQQH